MVKRRKFVIGLGALAAGSGAAMGTGAFSSASIEDRSVNVAVNNDMNSQIALVPGGDPDISLSSNTGELQLDLTGSNGEGVNINSRYTWGDPNDPANDHAFKLVNNDESTYQGSGSGGPDAGAVDFSYAFDDGSWLSNGDDQSFIRFQVFRSAGGATAGIDFTAPDQYQGNTNTLNGVMLDGSNAWAFAPGDEWYVVVTVDTTGSDASTSDELTGALSIDISERN